MTPEPPPPPRRPGWSWDGDGPPSPPPPGARPSGGRAAVRLDGRYELLAELGRGVMGVVYRAREVASGREVALETLHESDHRARVERLLVSGITSIYLDDTWLLRR